MDDLTGFIVTAKAATYMGQAAPAVLTPEGAHEIGFARGDYTYRDSYFGGTDFLGREVVWHHGEPVWVMQYYGRVLRPDLIDGARAAAVIRAALTAMYAEGRFLGGFDFRHGGYDYCDRSEGPVAGFAGVETIHAGGVLAYRLDYHGGMVAP